MMWIYDHQTSNMIYKLHEDNTINKLMVWLSVDKTLNADSLRDKSERLVANFNNEIRNQQL